MGAGFRPARGGATTRVAPTKRWENFRRSPEIVLYREWFETVPYSEISLRSAEEARGGFERTGKRRNGLV